MMSAFVKRVVPSLVVLGLCACGGSDQPGKPDARPAVVADAAEKDGVPLPTSSDTAMDDSSVLAADDASGEAGLTLPAADARDAEAVGQDSAGATPDLARDAADGRPDGPADAPPDLAVAAVDTPSAKLVLSAPSAIATATIAGCAYPPEVSGTSTAVVTVSNVGRDATAELRVRVVRGSADTTSTCSAHLAAGATCTVTVRTKRTSPGLETIKVAVFDGAVEVYAELSFTIVDKRVCLDGGQAEDTEPDGEADAAPPDDEPDAHPDIAGSD